MQTYLADKERLRGLIEVAAGRRPAELCIRNGRVLNVYTGEILEEDILISDGHIAALGRGYIAKQTIDAEGAYIVPAFIDAHIHVESSCTSPEELGRLLIPHGTGTIIADPHEIVNVRGLDGLNYMLRAAEHTPLDIRYMMPSCVPATEQEHSGAVLGAAEMAEPLAREEIQGVGEFMDFPGVVQAKEAVLDKLVLGHKLGKVIDGHSPGLEGQGLAAYIASGIKTDHECATVEEARERLRRGMYVQLRLGSACHDLPNLVPVVDAVNYRRCLLCSDDRQAKTILEQGHMEEHLRLCVAHGISAHQAICMASLNAAECYGLTDRGAIAPGLRADLVFLDNLKDFHVLRCFLGAVEQARDGRYLGPRTRASLEGVEKSCCVKDFSQERLALPLKQERVRVIGIQPGGVLTAAQEARVRRDAEGCFCYNPEQDIVKLAVIERHHGLGNVALGLLGNYGLRRGAIAQSIAHDSHNILVAGCNDADMAQAVERLLAIDGGVVLVAEGQVLAELSMPIAGLMSDQPGEYVAEKLEEIHQLAIQELGVHASLDPTMTLGFMSLAVIPELKLTDMGLFDVGRFDFVDLELEG